MKIVTLVAMTFICVFGGSLRGHAGCFSEEQQIKAKMQQLNAQASSLGICQSARAMVSAYQQAYYAFRRCNDHSQHDLDILQDAIAQAQATAAAACR